MASKSGVRINLRASALPLLDAALDLARSGNIAGGLERNRAYYTVEADAPVELGPGLDSALTDVLFDPQTSGGLLFAVPAAASSDFSDAMSNADITIWHVGSVGEGTGVVVTT